MSEDDPWDPNYRSLRDAIAEVSKHLTVPRAESELRRVLASGDLPTVLQWPGGERKPLTGWKDYTKPESAPEQITLDIEWYADCPNKLMHDHDITIVRGGLEALDPNLIFVWWPDVERLCGLAEPPKPQLKPAPKAAAAKTPTPARGSPKRAATPKQKPAKRRTKQANRQTERLERKLVNAGLARLRDKYREKYSKGFSKTLSPSDLIRQMKPLWAEVCKAEDVKPEDYPLDRMWDTFARAIGRRKDRPRR